MYRWVQAQAEYIERVKTSQGRYDQVAGTPNKIPESDKDIRLNISTHAKAKYVPSDAPVFMSTSNKLDYVWNNVLPAVSAKRPEIKLMG